MATDFYRLSLPPPCRVGDYVQVGKAVYQVPQLEPLYYEFRNIVAGVDVGFVTNIYPVPEMTPAQDKIHYVTAWGINGRVAAQIRYQSGNPRNTSGARSVQRLDRFQASHLQPYTFTFVVVAGDTMEVDILSEIPNVRAAVWFYGWKLYVSQVPAGQLPANAVVLPDVRSL